MSEPLVLEVFSEFSSSQNFKNVWLAMRRSTSSRIGIALGYMLYQPLQLLVRLRPDH